MNTKTAWIIVAAVAILAVIVYLYKASKPVYLYGTGTGTGTANPGTGNSGKGPSVNTSTPTSVPCNPNAEKYIVRDCNWQNPIHDGCTYVKKDIKPGTNNTMCYWFKK